VIEFLGGLFVMAATGTTSGNNYSTPWFWAWVWIHVGCWVVLRVTAGITGQMIGIKNRDNDWWVIRGDF